jgi:tungstate transport system substrate-binding protein
MTGARGLPRSIVVVLLLVAATVRAQATAPTTAPSTQPTIRCAVIGGMFFTGFWQALAERYEKQAGVHVELVATGPKNDITKVFEQGKADLITMHASDTIVNLVADGYALDPQPWMRNDLIILGPPDDPAGIKGMTDAADALRQIAATKSPFVVHSSLGAQEVLLSILDLNEITLDPDHTTVLFDDQQRRVLKVAADKHAYTLVGRVPFRIGRLPNAGLVQMVQGDPRLRRPFMVAVTNPRKFPGARVADARRFAAYVRSPETQQWIAGYGRGQLDDQPIFYPVTTWTPPATRPGVLLSVSGEVEHPFDLAADMLAQLPHVEVRAMNRDGKEERYRGVPIGALLAKAGMPAGPQQLRGKLLARCVVVEGSDGYEAVFSMPELSPELGERAVILADSRDGKPLDPAQGTLRIVVPQDPRPSRWVRGVVAIRVASVGD